MNFLFGLILLFSLLFSFSLSQDLCNNFNLSNCTACTNQANCGWCTTVQQCLSGNITGPSSAVCLGNAWQFGTGNCVPCETISDCRQCLANQGDCGWCATTQECLPLDEFGSRLGMKCKAPVANCPCGVYTSCGQCLISPNCKWCQGDGACRDISGMCTSGPSYNKTVGCQCDTNPDCRTCLDGFNCQWCQNLATCQVRGTNGTGCLPALGTCNAYCALNGNASCSKCNNLNGCGWCPTTQSCVDIEASNCLLMHTCDTCPLHSYCEPCSDDPNCFWCEDGTGTCQNRKNVANCKLLAHSCEDYCNWMTAQGCSACNARKGCGWCNARGTCMDYQSGSCDDMWLHTCSPTPLNPAGKCGFDGGAFVGGMFLVVGLIVLGVIAYIVYRWKTGRKILYTELR